MPATYTYKARDKSGKVITGSLMADNEGLVLNRLREMGHTPLEVGKQKKSMNLEINLHPGRVKLKVMSVFSRQFATMINAGLPILRALAILADQTDNTELRKILTQVRLDVEQGASLSQAMQKHPGAFNNLYILNSRSRLRLRSNCAAGLSPR